MELCFTSQCPTERPSARSKQGSPYSALHRQVFKELGRWALGHTDIYYILLREWVHSVSLCSSPDKGHRNICQTPVQLHWQVQGLGRRESHPLELWGPQARLWRKELGRPNEEGGEGWLTAREGRDYASLGYRYITLNRNQVGSAHCLSQVLTVSQWEGWEVGAVAGRSAERVRC